MKRKKKKLTPEQLEKRRDAAFRKEIRDSFINAGFVYISTVNKPFVIGRRKVELDYVFIYENILLICEDTCAAKKNKGHIRKKKEAFEEIKSNFSDFYRWLCDNFPEKTPLLEKYREERFLTFFLYCSQNELELSSDEKDIYNDIIFVKPQTLHYFYKISLSIRRSARYEIFRFLGLKSEQIGLSSSESGITKIKAPIIYPKDITGIYNGVRVVSFMMSAEKLLSTCYVMRKDNWEESIWLYQRLIEKDKIKSIRNFLATKGEAFYNNIIVGLPDNVRFTDRTGNSVSISQIGDLENCKLEIPEEMNSICVIDGQHRIYAHYEGPEGDRQEEKISLLRKQLHLLVTGLIFPPQMTPIERAQIQSEIFRDINSNAKAVPPSLILQIEMILDPFSDVGLARRIIERLNKRKVFLNMFELSALEGTKIKVASIVRFALRYLVSTKPSEGKVSLYTCWDGDKEAMKDKKEGALEEYIDFCVNNLDIYFSAVKNNNLSDWNDPGSKIRSVIALNGFIIAYNRQLKVNGLQTFDFYNTKFKGWTMDFSRENFSYTASQYRKFSTQILEEVFGISDPEI